MNIKRFNEITETSDLITFLQEMQRLNNVKAFNKYMRLSSVIRLLSTGVLLINNPKRMNDLYEYKAFSNQVDWSKICFCSFITQSTESMAMWSMYAQPWDEGVLLSFPAADFKQMVKNTHFLISAEYDEKNDAYNLGKDTIPCDGLLHMTRVAYSTGTTITCTNRDDRNYHFPNPYTFPELAGYIKDSAWDYEKETRLRVDLPASYQSDAAFIKIPDSLLSQITIVTGPRFEGNVLTTIPTRFKARIKIEPSKFKEKIAWIPCDTCECKKHNKK